MEHSTPAITEIHTQLLQLRGTLDSLQEQLNDITISEDDSAALNAYLIEKEQGALLSDEQTSVALGA